MDQQFEGDVMQDLMAEGPAAPADDAFEAEVGLADEFGEDGMEEDMGADELDAYDEAEEDYLDEEGYEDGFEGELGDEFAGDELDEAGVLEEAMADALAAEDGDEFISRLINGARRVFGAIGRVASGGRGLAGAAQRLAGGNAGGGSGGSPASAGLPAILQRLLPMLQQRAAQGADEMDVFEDLADWYEDEAVDEALPVLAALAARSALRPLVRRGVATAGRAVRRQLVRSATQAARQLIRRQGPRAIRALPRIARSVGRTAVRRGARPAALPVAQRQTAARVVRQPALVRRLSGPVSARPRVRAVRARRGAGHIARRFILRGPVEIIVRR